VDRSTHPKLEAEHGAFDQQPQRRSLFLYS